MLFICNLVVMKSKCNNTFHYGNRLILKSNISYSRFCKDNHIFSQFNKKLPIFLHGFGKYVKRIFDIQTIIKGGISLLVITSFDHTHVQLLSIYMIVGVMNFWVISHNYGNEFILWFQYLTVLIHLQVGLSSFFVIDAN